MPGSRSTHGCHPVGVKGDDSTQWLMSPLGIAAGDECRDKATQSDHGVPTFPRTRVGGSDPPWCLGMSWGAQTPGSPPGGVGRGCWGGDRDRDRGYKRQL